ncbi:primosomal replication protein N [Hydrogenophilus thermoluteolus]|uniref:primosomal replication protein N n=1 Tax=Hydrogenophilus thermoluteolus TaxID=297 RepID=UPI003F673782
MGANRCRLTFDVTARDALRYTPAGLAVSEGEGWHRSMQCEVGRTREVDFRFHWVAMGEVATVMDALPMGAEVTGEGFSRHDAKAVGSCSSTSPQCNGIRMKKGKHNEFR